jgi:hypothetical protein
MKAIHLALGAAVLAFGSYAEAGPLVPIKTVDIKFDGFCDGMRLVINQSSGEVRGNDTGCVSDPLIGTVGGLSKIGAGISVMSRGFLYVIDDSPTRWTLYLSDGTLLQSGTYSLGVPAAFSIQSGPATGSP